MRNRNIVLSLLVAGGAAFAGLTFADTPAVPSNAGHHIVLVDDKGEKVEKVEKSVKDRTVTDAEYMQHLRDSRKHLEEAKSAFDGDLPLRSDREDVLKPIDKAIDTIDLQIKAFEDSLKKK